MKTIYVADQISHMVDQSLKDLPNCLYRIQKIRIKDETKYVNIELGESFVGKVKVLPFSNMTPYISFGGFPYGGMHTSIIVGTREFNLPDEEYKQYTNKLIVETENSEYMLIGPIEDTDE